MSKWSKSTNTVVGLRLGCGSSNETLSIKKRSESKQTRWPPASKWSKSNDTVVLRCGKWYGEVVVVA